MLLWEDYKKVERQSNISIVLQFWPKKDQKFTKADSKDLSNKRTTNDKNRMMVFRLYIVFTFKEMK